MAKTATATPPTQLPLGTALSTLRPKGVNLFPQQERRKDLAEYVEMLACDPQARQVMEYANALVINLIGEYQHPDEKLEVWVKSTLQNMRGNWSACQRWLLQGRVFGFAVSERVWGQAQVEGKQSWVYDALLPIPFESLLVNALKMDRTSGKLEQVTQWASAGQGSEVVIPGDKITHWAYDDRGDGYGLPLGKGMLPLYKAKRATQEAWAKAVEWRGQPPIYEVVADGRVIGANGTEMSRAQDAAESWATAKSSAILIRSTPPGDWNDKGLPRAEVLQGTAFGDEFSRHIDFTHQGYGLALGLPYLVMFEPQHGTRAQSVVHSDVAKFGALPIAEEFAESCLVAQVVRPLVEANWGPQDDYGSFPCSLPMDEEFVANILTALAGAGFLGMMVDQRVYNHWQERLPEYLPEIEEGGYYGETGAPASTNPQPPPALPPELGVASGTGASNEATLPGLAAPVPRPA